MSKMTKGQWPENKQHECYQLKTRSNQTSHVHIYSIVRIDIYEEPRWEFLQTVKPTFFESLFCINKVPKTYKGKTVYYVGFHLCPSPAIEDGMDKMMRLHLIDGTKVEAPFDTNLVNDFTFRKNPLMK